ncbi:hypothetical protein [Burkholderia lata]|uniref:hypothetical protein n=1 Tax=Burkholderia lata (strain ATCC 17760 / DSM 23089 / LMG 22485 / NCIMB 9086 / R18194 / 383) TaxID=482957 RepID=UPI001581C848|nr:hypothetical protein [Burkholderia lata]
MEKAVVRAPFAREASGHELKEGGAELLAKVEDRERAGVAVEASLPSSEIRGLIDVVAIRKSDRITAHAERRNIRRSQKVRRMLRHDARRDRHPLLR